MRRCNIVMARRHAGLVRGFDPLGGKLSTGRVEIPWRVWARTDRQSTPAAGAHEDPENPKPRKRRGIHEDQEAML
jgi:hypothetical protein